MVGVSVGIPVYNGEDYLMQAVNSVINQNYDNYEIIIIDNASKDKTFKIMQKIKNKKVRIYKNKKNIGSINNFNLCIEKAKKEFFMLLPHDDFLLPNFLNDFSQAMKDNRADFIYSSFNIINENNEIIKKKKYYEENKKFTLKEFLIEISINPFPTQIGFFKTSILRQVGGYKKNYGPFCDAVLVLEYLKKSKRNIIYLSNSLFCHRSHKEQGQNAFTNFDLKILSKHWGQKLQKNFFMDNGYNLGFLKYVTMVYQETKKFKGLNSFKNRLIILLIKSNLSLIFKTILKLNFFLFVNEIKIFLKIYKLVSFRVGVFITAQLILDVLMKKMRFNWYSKTKMF